MRAAICPVTSQAFALRRVVIVLAALITWVSSAAAQQDNPVYVDDSPQAWELFQQAQDQTRHNVGEAVRLYQELLDEFALKLIPVSEAAGDQFTSVRRRVHHALRSEPAMLARYRMIQTPEAQQRFAAGELERVARTRGLTQPGLDALLQLAQRDLESARFRSALLRLDEAIVHPDFAGRAAAHAWFMRALAFHDAGDIQQAAEARASLAGLGSDAAPFLAQLDEIANGPQPPSSPSLTALDRGPSTELNDLVPQAIWTAPFETRDSLRRLSELSDAAAEAEIASEARRATVERAVAVPTIADTVVYVNYGHTILALNRLTGRQIWAYSDISRFGLLDREGAEPLDLNVVAVGEGCVVTLTGHAQPTTRSDGGKVICLNAADGTVRWAGTLSGLVESSAGEELFPHGAPLIADSMAFFMARKVSPQLLTSAYIIAVDLSDGAVRWIRYLTSSGGLRGARPFCSLEYHGGALYVASAVGAAARLDPGSGEIRWLQRFSVPISPMLIDQTRKPWEMTAPVITRRGMVTVQSDQRRVALLDLETGDILESHNAASSADWSLPRYLLADDDHVYAIGADIRAFSIDDLERPLWRLPPVPQISSEPDGLQAANAPTSLELRGRVQLLDGTLIVPSTEGVHVVDADTGAVRHTLAVTPGNPLAADSQLLLAGSDRLEAFMSFDRAERMLRERIAANPHDPEPSLSLLRLGMRVRNMTLCLEAAELATASLNQMLARDAADRTAATTRAELFGLLLELSAARVASSVVEGEALFAAMQAVAVEREQQVDYLLAYGDWLTSHALNRAVESYQEILNPGRGLAQTWRSAGGIAQPASTWAAERLAALIEQRGKSVYGPQSDFAAMRLRSLMSTSGGREPDPQRLMETVALEFPLADAAADAAIAAANIYEKRGEPRRAMHTLMATHRLAPRAPASGKLLGRAAGICLDAGWTAEARELLAYTRRAFGDIPMSAGAGERRASAWLDAINASTLGTAARPAKLAQVVSGEAETLTATTLLSATNAIPLPTDRAIVRSGGELRGLGVDLNQLWSGKLENENVQLLRWSEQSMLLVAEMNTLDPKAIRVSVRDNTVSVSASDALSQTIPAGPDGARDPMRRGPGSPGGGGGQRGLPDGQFLDGTSVVALAHPSDQTIIMLRGNGSGAAFELPDRAARATVLWTRPASDSEQVYGVALHDSALAIAVARREQGARGMGDSTVILRNPRTGEPYDSPPQAESRPALGRNGVKWMVIAPLGTLIIGAVDGIEAVDLYSGERRWTQMSYQALDSQRAWVVDDYLVFEDQRSRLRSVNLLTGAISETFENPARGDLEPLDLVAVLPHQGQVLAHYRQRLVMYNPATGAITGADAIGQNRDFRWAIPLDTHILLIEFSSEQAPLNEQGARHNRFHYQFHVLSHNGLSLREPRALEPLPDRVHSVWPIDGWVLMSTSTGTVAVPMSPANDMN